MVAERLLDAVDVVLPDAIRCFGERQVDQRMRVIGDAVVSAAPEERFIFRRIGFLRDTDGEGRPRATGSRQMIDRLFDRPAAIMHHQVAGEIVDRLSRHRHHRHALQTLDDAPITQLAGNRPDDQGIDPAGQQVVQLAAEHFGVFVVLRLVRRVAALLLMLQHVQGDDRVVGPGVGERPDHPHRSCAPAAQTRRQSIGLIPQPCGGPVCFWPGRPRAAHGMGMCGSALNHAAQ